MAAHKTRRKAAAARPRKRGTSRRYSKPRTHNTRRKTGLKAVAHHRRHHTARARPSNYRRRSHHPVVRPTSRSPNPFLGGVTGIFEGGLTALIGMVLTDTLFGLAASTFGAYLGGNPLIGIGVKLGIAWGVGEGARKFGFQKHANLLAIGGAVSAGKDAMNYFVGGGGLLFPQPTVQVAAAPGRALVPASATGDDGSGMNDLTWAPAYMGDITYGPMPQAYYG